MKVKICRWYEGYPDSKGNVPMRQEAAKFYPGGGYSWVAFRRGDKVEYNEARRAAKLIECFELELIGDHRHPNCKIYLYYTGDYGEARRNEKLL